MASLAQTGTRFNECPTCKHLTPYPVALDQPPICVKCLQGEWPDDPKPRFSESEASQLIIVLAIFGTFFLVLSAVLSNLGYL